jgi:hypothetical protein
MSTMQERKSKSRVWITSIVKDVPHDTPFIRSTIIPYHIKNGKKYLALFQDTRYRELTDGGGQNQGRPFIDVAIEELKEESLHIFNIKKETMGECLCFYTSEKIVIFVEYSSENMYEYSELFLDKYRSATLSFMKTSDVTTMKTLENCSMYWVSEENIIKLVNGEKVLCPERILNKYLNVNLKSEIRGLILPSLMKSLEVDENGINKITIPKTPIVKTKYKKDPNSDIVFDKMMILKHNMTPYWFFKIFFEKHEDNPNVYPPLWGPIKFFFKSIYHHKTTLF